ncbi:MAG: ATP-binding protein [Luteolibacter sp.]|uniref:sensor histidine kinase n=1 Tax=Luteolibacter sp. TaxID=1962973 RepID=UPI0032670271
MTITRRILTQVAVAAGAVVAVVSAVAYGIVFDTTKERELENLKTYVAERTRREETGFRQVEANLATVRGQFLKRIAEPAPADWRERWDDRFELFPDGSWRSRRKFADGRKYSTLWMHRDADLTKDLQVRILHAQNICDELLPSWGDSFPSLYFNFPGPSNIGFDPTIPSWVWDTPADYDMNGQEWVKMAFPENNPSRGFTWTGVVEEEVTKTPQVAVLLPIDVGGEMLCSVAHSINVRGMIEETTHGVLPGVSQMIFRRDGRLIAHPEAKERIISSKGLLTAAASGDPMLVRLYGIVSKTPDKLFSGYDVAAKAYFVAARLEGPDWFFVTVMPRTLLQRQAFASAKWVLWSGLLSLALVLGVFAWILRRQVARPLAEFARVTGRMSAGDTDARAVVSGDDELGRLAGDFNEMVSKVAARGAELKALNLSLEERVAERTRELRESEERFGKAFQASPALIALTRIGDGTFIAANDAFYRISGYPEEEVIGHSSLDLNIYARPVQRDEYVSEVKARGSVRDREHELRDKSGNLRTILTSGEIIELDGEPHLLTVGLDITDRKHAELEMARALTREKELGELKSSFISMVSHEFRTPLGVILSAADVLERYFDRLSAEDRACHLEMIQRSTKNLAKLMEEVLLLGTVEEGRMRFTPAPVDLDSLARSLADEMISATQSACPIVFKAHGPLVGAVCDESLVRHILTNLLSNAVKYSEPGSPVDFIAARDGGNVIITVRDRGIGIPVEDRERIFRSFTRGRNVGLRPGTGLGLLIVERCVQLHGGSVDLVSTPGSGTIVTITLPAFI